QCGYLSRVRQADCVSTASEEDVRLVQIIRICTNTYTAAPYAEVSECRSVVVNDVGCSDTTGQQTRKCASHSVRGHVVVLFNERDDNVKQVRIPLISCTKVRCIRCDNDCRLGQTFREQVIHNVRHASDVHPVG